MARSEPIAAEGIPVSIMSVAFIELAPGRIEGCSIHRHPVKRFGYVAGHASSSGDSQRAQIDRYIPPAPADVKVRRVVIVRIHANLAVREPHDFRHSTLLYHDQLASATISLSGDKKVHLLPFNGLTLPLRADDQPARRKRLTS